MSINWKRAARKLRTKYRIQLLVERARTEANKNALKMLFSELSDAVQGQVQIIDAQWDDDGEPSN